MVVSIRTVAGKNAVSKGMGWFFGESDDDVAEARRMFSQKKKNISTISVADKESRYIGRTR